MPCYTPMKGYLDSDGVVKIGDSEESSTLLLPCGKCIGCRNDMTKDWAVRAYHESQLHDYSSVLTLTFDEDHLNRSLDKQDAVKFIKRLRIYLSRSEHLRENYPHFYKKKISYLYCGEYGSKFNRPHYHIIIFGFDFPDKVYLKDSESGDEIYISKILSELWPFGYATIGKMSMASAMYCASYVTKYVSNAEKESIYTDVNTGEYRQPEFGHASRCGDTGYKKPSGDPILGGLGLKWLIKYHDDILTHNCVIIANQKYRIPRYYLKKMEELFPSKYEKLKILREESLDSSSVNYNDLKNKYTISMARIKDKGTLKSLDNHKRLEYLKNVLSH